MTFPATALWETAREAACRVAVEAWGVIQPIYEGEFEVEIKPDTSPTTEADKQADRLIVQRLRREFPSPQYGYLSEEGEHGLERLECPRVWIIDPIDGTRDFIKRNGNFAVHIGLVERLEDGLWHPVASAVYWPVAGLMFSAVRGQGARRQKIAPRLAAGQAGPLGPAQPLRVSRLGELRQMRPVVSETYQTSRLMRLLDSLELQGFRHLGSLGIKLCLIAGGEADLYVNIALGRSKEWDTCAPELILTEAGGALTTLEGDKIHYNKADVAHHQGLLATNGVAHAAILAKVRRFLKE
jgi:3'(2'), 5'-bisphosphate nucleotidase